MEQSTSRPARRIRDSQSSRCTDDRVTTSDIRGDMARSATSKKRGRRSGLRRGTDRATRDRLRWQPQECQHGAAFGGTRDRLSPASVPSPGLTCHQERGVHDRSAPPTDLPTQGGQVPETRHGSGSVWNVPFVASAGLGECWCRLLRQRRPLHAWRLFKTVDTAPSHVGRHKARSGLPIPRSRQWDTSTLQAAR